MALGPRILRLFRGRRIWLLLVAYAVSFILVISAMQRYIRSPDDLHSSPEQDQLSRLIWAGRASGLPTLLLSSAPGRWMRFPTDDCEAPYLTRNALLSLLFLPESHPTAEAAGKLILDACMKTQLLSNETGEAGSFHCTGGVAVTILLT